MAPHPNTDMCGGRTLRGVTMWWDPATRLVLSELAYTTGGCMCPTDHLLESHRIPAEAPAR